MADVFKTLVTLAANKDAANLACATVPGGTNTFSVPLALATDPTVITHWGASGYVNEDILPLMWPTACDISEDQPQAMLTRLGLVMWQDPNGI